MKVAAIKASFMAVGGHLTGERDGRETEGAIFLVQCSSADEDLIFKSLSHCSRTRVQNKILEACSRQLVGELGQSLKVIGLHHQRTLVLFGKVDQRFAIAIRRCVNQGNSVCTHLHACGQRLCVLAHEDEGCVGLGFHFVDERNEFLRISRLVFDRNHLRS